jgi:DNA-binding transcriptional ArsR family regulator
MFEDGFEAVAGVTAEPDEIATLGIEGLRLLSQDLRLALIQEVQKAPRTVRQLADRLGVPATRLYYHLDRLVQHGVVKVVATRQVSGITERLYRAAGRSFRPDPDLLAGAPAQIADAILAGLRDEIARGFAGPAPDTADRRLLTRSRLLLRPDDRARLVTRLLEVVTEFADLDLATEDDPDGTPDDAEHLGLVVGVYPIVT